LSQGRPSRTPSPAWRSLPAASGDRLHWPAEYGPPCPRMTEAGREACSPLCAECLHLHRAGHAWPCTCSLPLGWPPQAWATEPEWRLPQLLKHPSSPTMTAPSPSQSQHNPQVQHTQIIMHDANRDTDTCAEQRVCVSRRAPTLYLTLQFTPTWAAITDSRSCSFLCASNSACTSRLCCSCSTKQGPCNVQFQENGPCEQGGN
jgi:hypothetical protein